MTHVEHFEKGISQADFDKILADNPLVLVDVYTVWCGPCKMMTPILENIAGEMQDVKFISVDLDQARWIGTKYGIAAIPTFLMFKDQKLVKNQVGGMPQPQFHALIEESLKGE